MSLKNKIAFVVIPGFAPDNYPVIHLRDELLSLGYQAVAVPFWGDFKIENFHTLTIKQAREGISNIISSLSKEYKTVVGIGISLGGALLLEHAKINSDLNYIVSIGTPFKLKNRKIIKLMIFFYPAISVFWKIGEKMGIKRMLPIDAGKTVFSYLEGDFLEDLGKIKTPLLLLHCQHDMVTDVKVLPFFMDKIMSKEKNIIYFKNIGHTIGYDEKLDKAIINNIIKYFPKEP